MNIKEQKQPVSDELQGNCRHVMAVSCDGVNHEINSFNQ